jgi:2-(1,2-epoxy-1,2-dihydrophenyl)acetyl-CoA isomerase
MPEKILLTELDQGVLTITLNRPKANAFNHELTEALKQALAKAEKDKAVRSIVLAATGKIFSAGQDLKVVKEKGQISFLEHLNREYHPLILQMRRLEKPILAAINGPVAGAALGIVLACDLRIASENARFIVAFGGIGLAPDSAVSLFLPAVIGLGRAAEAAYFNKPIDAQNALDWGLLNKIVPQEKLMEETREWAASLAAGLVGAIGLTKRDFNQAVLPNLEAVLEHEAQIQEIAGNAPEHKEGLAAFLEGRDPDYTKLDEI